MSEIRTRYAPSPTGYMHVGNLRTALYEYLIAKRENGKFILRIEDTDRERLVEGATEVIYNTLKLVGMEHDEGPDVGGEYGPYIQSERKDIYLKYAKQLVEQGDAYYCFCDKDEIEAQRKKCEEKKIPYKYNGKCKHLSKDEVEEKLKSGVPYVIRQKIPDFGETVYEDVVYGKITVENKILDENILIKSDGYPTYNFANVVDDHLMHITDVIRGNEYISSTPKYVLLYKAFGWETPRYIHLPPIMGEDGKKLSKRNGDASFQDLYNEGYLKEAIVNYIILLGWHPGTEEEFFTLDELKQRFSIEGLSKSPAIFDIKKLKWMNGEYIRKLSLEEFCEMATPYLKKAIKNPNIDFMKVSKVLHVRTEVLSEIPEQIDFIDNLPEYDVDMYVHKKMKTDKVNSLENLNEVYEVLDKQDNWDFDSLHEVIFKLIEKKGIKNGQMLWPIRTALSGKQFTPGGAIEFLEILGKEESLNRIRKGIDMLSA